MEEKRKQNNKTKWIFIVVIVFVIVLLNLFFILVQSKRREEYKVYSKEHLEDAFEEQFFPRMNFEKIVQTVNGKMAVVCGYNDVGNTVCCAVFTQSVSYDRWRCEKKVTLDKGKNPSSYEYISPYGKAYLFWNTFGVAQIVVEKSGKEITTEITPNEFICHILDEETDDVRFYSEEGTEILKDEIFP